MRFASRAKMIRNKAIVNQDIQGNVTQLQEEIRRLKIELATTKREDYIDIYTYEFLLMNLYPAFLFFI